MRRCLILCGLTGVVGIVVALRELHVLNQANALGYGMIAGCWAVFFGAGLWLSSRWIAARGHGANALALGLALCGATLPVSLSAMRCSLLLFPPLQTLSLLPAMAVVSLLPTCACLGFVGALTMQIDLRGTTVPLKAAVRVGGFSLIGVVVGGVMTGGLLLAAMNPLQVCLTVAALDALAAFVLWWHTKERRLWGWFLLPVVAVLIIGAVTPFSDVADFLSLTVRYPDRVLRFSSEDAPGRSDVTGVLDDHGRSTAFEFFLNGALVGGSRTTPDEEDAALIAVLSHPAPRRLLVIDGAPHGIARKALDVPWLRVDFVPFTSQSPSVVEEFVPGDAHWMASPRLRIVRETDPRRWLMDAPGRYDVVLVNIPPQATDVANRCSTEQFLRLARRSLARNGVFALRIGFHSPLTGPDQLLIGSTLRTLSSVFVSTAVRAAPHGVFFFGAPAKRPGFPEDSVWMARLRQWNLRASWLNDLTVRDLAGAQRTALLLGTQKLPGVRINSDLHPVSNQATLASWSEAWAFKSGRPLAWALRLDLPSLLLGILLMTGIASILLTLLPHPMRFGLPVTQVYSGIIAGAVLMALLSACQSFSGMVYGHGAYIIAAFAAGAALGMLLGGRYAGRRGDVQMLMLLGMALAVLTAGCVPLLTVCGRGVTAFAWAGALAGTPVMALGMGLIIGMQTPFSIAASLDDNSGNATRAIVLLWTATFLGVCAGSWFGGCAVLPVLGTANTCYAASVLAAATLPLLLLSDRRRQRAGTVVVGAETPGEGTGATGDPGESCPGKSTGCST